MIATVNMRSIVFDDPVRYLIPFAVLILLLMWWSTWKRASRTIRKRLPGPTVNLLGDNSGQFNPVAPFLAFHQWAKSYGPIFQVKLGSQHIISVNDPTLAKILFEKRGNRYSSRISPHVSFDLLSQGRRIAFAPSGAMHRAFRKQLQSILSITRTAENQKHQELESRQLMRDMLDLYRNSETSLGAKDQSKPQDIFRRYTASVMFTLAFGHRIPDLQNDKFATTVFEIMHDNSIAVQPGRYYADIFPWLRRLPYVFRTWEHEAQRKVQWQWPFLRQILGQVEQQKSRGVQNPGLVRAILDQREGIDAHEQEARFSDDKSIAYQSLTVVEAGSDTTAISLMNFTLAMVMNPTMVKKAQLAIDAAIPDTRLPRFDDIDKLPYVRQIVKETLRWRPPIVMGIPHANNEEDEVNGYEIPRSSMIIGNIWAMHQDSRHYAAPETFNPDRYNGSFKNAFESSTEPNAMDRDHYTFGWGRRICPGIHIAESSLLLLVARLLWAFEIVQSIDVTGKPIHLTADPLTDYDNSIIQSPKVFPVTFKLRSQQRGNVIYESYNEALQIWDGLCLDLFKE